MRQAAEPQPSLLDDTVAPVAYGDDAPALPAEDNTPEALQQLLAANAYLRGVARRAQLDQQRNRTGLSVIRLRQVGAS
jgi:hypothetical protein